ncbi:MAG TPA: NAD(P)-binding oxidoreductase, partial [Pseudogracilibacillus sp.]|nr:NAD(P)-binding oxidoreductase [Pseudogracilibacillus sp.]
AIQAANESFAPYVIAKHYADEWLRATDLQHTIIHPGLLTNDDGTGNITAAPTVERDEVPRVDVAKVILTCLESDATIGKEFQVVKGETKVGEAIQGL